MIYTSSNFENLQLIANDYASDNMAYQKPENDNNLRNVKNTKNVENKTSIDHKKESGKKFKEELKNKSPQQTTKSKNPSVNVQNNKNIKDQQKQQIDKTMEKQFDTEIDTDVSDISIFNIDNLLAVQSTIEENPEITPIDNNMINSESISLNNTEMLPQELDQSLPNNNPHTKQDVKMVLPENNNNDKTVTQQKAHKILPENVNNTVEIQEDLVQSDDVQNTTDELTDQEPTENIVNQTQTDNQNLPQNQLNQNLNQEHKNDNQNDPDSSNDINENSSDVSSMDTDINNNTQKSSIYELQAKKTDKIEPSKKDEQSNNLNSTHASTTSTSATLDLNENKNIENTQKLNNIEIQKSIANQTKTSIVECITKGQNSFEFQLNPKDLGTVKLTIDFLRDKSIKINIETTTSNAIDAIRQETISIENTVKELGFELNNGSLTFSFKDQSKEQQNFDNNFSQQKREQSDDIQPKVYQSKRYINIINNSNVDMIV